MNVVTANSSFRTTLACLLCTCLSAACSGSQPRVSVGDEPDAGVSDGGMATGVRCDRVEVDGDVVLEHEQDFTARYRMGEPYTKTVMLFGGERVEEEDTLSNMYVFGLDKADAQMLAVKYPDFYLCSSPGGQEASKYIISYDLVPASCDVYEQLVTALWEYFQHVESGGDRTSLRIEGAALQLESVTNDTTGEDLMDQVGPDHNFNLVTGVEQLTGESVLDFGTMK